MYEDGKNQKGYLFLYDLSFEKKVLSYISKVLLSIFTD
jgi:hypothetical protein